VADRRRAQRPRSAPPFTCSTCPVTNDASGEARYRTAAATSSACPAVPPASRRSAAPAGPRSWSSRRPAHAGPAARDDHQGAVGHANEPTRDALARCARESVVERPLLGSGPEGRTPSRPLLRRGGRVVRQRPAKPRTAVQFRSPPRGTHDPSVAGSRPGRPTATGAGPAPSGWGGGSSWAAPTAAEPSERYASNSSPS
jgi:hypothetical protein